MRAWAGTAADPFYIEGTVVTAVKTAIASGAPVAPDSFVPDEAANIFGGTDVGAIVLELADGSIPAGTIGFWGVAALVTDAGGWRQINRRAHPSINTLYSLEDAGNGTDFNATQLRDDRALYGPTIVRETAAVVAAMGTSDDVQHMPSACGMSSSPTSCGTRSAQTRISDGTAATAAGCSNPPRGDVRARPRRRGADGARRRLEPSSLISQRRSRTPRTRAESVAG